MQKIIEIKKNWPDDRLLIHYSLHNVCNYKCWYCFPGANEGTYRWPDLELTLNNLKHLLHTYQDKFDKRVFELNLLGGEPTLWPRLDEFIKGLKDEFGDKIIICMTTNGSRTLSWWKNNAKYFDKILISCHPETVDAAHISAVADLLYKSRVYVDVTVLMDPTRWDTCLGIINSLKQSRHRWSIQTSQLVGITETYTVEQEKYLKII